MASLHILPSVLIGLYIIIETIANLAVGADILDLLLRFYAPDANALCPLKGMIQFCLMGLVVPSISGGCRKLLGPFGVLVARWAAFFIVQ